MIITRTPVRITFFGGGTDYPEFFERHGGRTLGATINQYTYVLLRRLARLDPYRYRLVYSKSELCQSVEEVKQPVIRESLLQTGVADPLEIHYLADMPSFSGLGTSSSFAVCLLHGIYEYMGEKKTKEDFAKEAIHIERYRLKELVGVQDQYTCSYGGLISLDIRRSGDVTSVPVQMTEERKQELNDHLMLFYTGLTRYSHSVLPEQMNNTKTGCVDGYLNEMKDMVGEGIRILESRADLCAFGDLMDRGWMLKKKLSSNISSAAIDNMYDRAKKEGAVGGKILGAGAGGFMLLFVPPDRQTRVRLALDGYEHVHFRFESTGTQVMKLSIPGGT